MITVACLTSLVALNGKNPAGTGIPQLFTFTQTLERAQNDACGHPITGLAAVPPHPFVYAPSAFTVALQPISARGSSSRECQGMARGACAVSVRGGLAFSRPIPRARYADVDVAVRAAAAETILAFGNVPLARPVAPYGVGGVGAVRPLEEVAHGAPGSFAPACRWARWSRGPRLSVLCFRPLGDFFAAWMATFVAACEARLLRPTAADLAALAASAAFARAIIAIAMAHPSATIGLFYQDLGAR